MTLRSRPVLDRKHRPRWQDELRTQQLTVLGFAVAIALALGIFGAAMWNGFWESHFRPVAVVEGTTLTTADLNVRERILTAETVAQVNELAAQAGGPRDQFLQQQIEALSTRLDTVSELAAESLVDGEVLQVRADEFGASVTAEEVDAEVAERLTLPERVRARLILAVALPEDAEADDEPTEEQRAAAREEAQAALERVEGGEAFVDVAADVSEDFTATTGGELGWFEAGDPAYDEYFTALEGAEVGELVGPIDTERGAAVLELVERREPTRDEGLEDLLDEQGISDATYRDYVRAQLLVDAYRAHFDEEVVTSPAPQRRVAQIVIEPVTGEPVPQERARHILVQPDPELEDQAEATDEQWDAALEEAEEVVELVSADDADWFEIAAEHSDEPQAGDRGGDLGWSDPAASPYVPEFQEALDELDIDEISEPVRTSFGYHVIHKTGERESPAQQAADLVERLRADPDAFAETARVVSEDYATAQEDGELGWVARYQLSRMLEDAVFALTEEGEISEPIDDGTRITIYQLLETSESQEIEEERLDDIRTSGFERWLDEQVRSGVDTWLDPQYAATSTAS